MRDEDTGPSQFEDMMLLGVCGLGAMLVAEGLRLALGSIQARRDRGERISPVLGRLETAVLDIVRPAALPPSGPSS